MYGSKSFRKKGYPFTEKIGCPRAHGKNQFIDNIMIQSTNCLIPSNEHLGQNLYQSAETGSQRCKNINRNPGITYPYNGLEYLQNHFIQSVYNLMNKDPNKVSVNDTEFRFIIESTLNDLIWGQQQIGQYLLKNLNRFSDSTSNLLLGIFISMFVCILIISFLIFRPLPDILKHAALKTDWMDHIIKSVPNRIIPKYDINFSQVVVVDVPRIKEAHQEIAKTMSLIVKCIDEQRMQQEIFVYFRGDEEFKEESFKW
ncbi:MAG: hypothetical protein EZS28_024265 [Streblomastix strix]|uniref:Uncharacterized protein n=1 Tax=Streblomastix strix TaxID=222440 RepID=A0A5J4VCA0_9EUKA|nr:MAG: hypothetical protein EZS28_024265 [Streblomastix strix]